MKRMKLMTLAAGFLLLAQAAQADWQPVKRLTWTSGDSYLPRVAVDSSGNLHLVWYDLTGGTYDVYYKKSMDGGATWSTSKRLNWPTGKSVDPDISVGSSNKLHVVWVDYTTGNTEIYYKKSTDGGATWSTGKRLTSTADPTQHPAVAVDSSDNVHVVWSDETPGNYELYYKKSTDGGATWSTSKRLTWTSGDSHSPALAVDSSGDLHVAWYDDTPGNTEIYYKKSTDSGVTWSANKRLSSTANNSDFPDIVADTSGNLYVVWDDKTPGNFEIYFRTSPDAGATWSASKRITWTSGPSWSPTISVDPYGNLHLAWYDYTPGNSEIYYRKSNDRGTNWTPAERLTLTSSETWSPAICIDSSGNIYLVWNDNTPGNFEIYYRKGK